MGKAGDRRRTLEKKAERARRRQARLPASRPDLNAESGDPPAYPPPTVPAPADSSGSQNSDTLPQITAQHGLQQSGQSGEGSGHQDTHTHGVDPLGGLGGSSMVQPSRLMAGGVRDVRLIKRLIRNPDWKMPAGTETSLPIEAYLIAMNKRRVAGGRLEDADYSPHMRMKAVEVIQRMDDANKRKLAMAVRLSQLERKTNVIEEHPEALGGQTNNVVIILPEKADPSEFALPSERTVLPAQSGNGNGRAKA